MRASDGYWEPYADIGWLRWLAHYLPFVQPGEMATDLRQRCLTLAPAVVVIGLFAAVYATSNRESRYGPLTQFVGCYSNGRDRLLLLPSGRLRINGTAAGSYKILKPVGGKHGYLVEADGLKLTGGRGVPVAAMPGRDGFFWPISSEAIDVLFAPDIELSLEKARSLSC